MNTGTTSIRSRILNMVLLALFTAIVVALQMMGIAIRFGQHSVSMVGVPIILGGALMGPLAGAWLGLAFGVTVLFSGDATLFLTWDPVAAIVIVLLKGTLAGWAAGRLYRFLEKKSSLGAVLTAAVTYPIINTGIFFLGSLLFFGEDCLQFAENLGITGSAPMVIIIVFIGFNFLFELGLDLVLSGVMDRLIQIGKKSLRRA